VALSRPLVRARVGSLRLLRFGCHRSNVGVNFVNFRLDVIVSREAARQSSCLSGLLRYARNDGC